MKKYLYRTVSLLFIISTIFTNTTPVFAEKVRFDITIGSGEMIQNQKEALRQTLNKNIM